MKNIHVIPTDKPSSLYSLNIYSGLRFSKTEISKRDTHTPKNIYITNLEKTKLGEWVIYTNGIKIHCQKLDNKEDVELANIENSGVLKIILTTDADLIKDGVQAIDDDFLEWFVKNPSCEEVDVEKWFDTSHIDLGYGSKVYHNNPNMPLYKIIIPKEEPKQKETLEEVADRLNFIGRELYALKLGAKLQQERSYSEEEVLDIITKWEQQSSWKEFPEEWFEQFKKK